MGLSTVKVQHVVVNPGSTSVRMAYVSMTTVCATGPAPAMTVRTKQPLIAVG